jgi:hypothetical protein
LKILLQYQLNLCDQINRQNFNCSEKNFETIKLIQNFFNQVINTQNSNYFSIDNNLFCNNLLEDVQRLNYQNPFNNAIPLSNSLTNNFSNTLSNNLTSTLNSNLTSNLINSLTSNLINNQSNSNTTNKITSNLAPLTNNLLNPIMSNLSSNMFDVKYQSNNTNVLNLNNLYNSKNYEPSHLTQKRGRNENTINNINDLQKLSKDDIEEKSSISIKNSDPMNTNQDTIKYNVMNNIIN